MLLTEEQLKEHLIVSITHFRKKWFVLYDLKGTKGYSLNAITQYADYVDAFVGIYEVLFGADDFSSKSIVFDTDKKE